MVLFYGSSKGLGQGLSDVSLRLDSGDASLAGIRITEMMPRCSHCILLGGVSFQFAPLLMRLALIT